MKKTLMLCLMTGVGLLILMQHSIAADKKVKTPTLETLEDGTRRLLLPDDIQNFLISEFPNYRFPKESEFSSPMISYFFSNLIGVYPTVATGDFNNDKKKDYLFLLITGETKWGPMCELVAVNGGKGGFTSYRLGEIYNFKEDYVSFNEGKLYKGRFQRNGWYINWDPKKASYTVQKS